MEQTAERVRPLVVVVDDDGGMREALADLFRSIDIDVLLHASVDELTPAALEAANCLILDVRLPGQSGLELQDRIAARGSMVPIVFITGYGDLPMGIRAMKSGAVDFLTKPFRNQDLLDAVNAALRRDRERRAAATSHDGVARLAATLTPRERDVMELVFNGLMNKQIAFQLGIAEITVKIHRRNVMTKMEARTVADLVLKVRDLKDAQTSRSTTAEPHTKGGW